MLDGFRISVLSKLEFSRPGKLLCLVLTFPEHSGLLCSQLAGCGKLMHIGPERLCDKESKAREKHIDYVLR